MYVVISNHRVVLNAKEKITAAPMKLLMAEALLMRLIWKKHTFQRKVKLIVRFSQKSVALTLDKVLYQNNVVVLFLPSNTK